jgi:predicted small lipoprotein YifL
MSDTGSNASAWRGALLACLLLLPACGQKGPLYLPERTGEIVTRPMQTPAPPEDTKSPNTPRTIDSPPGPANPAPEVVGPEDDPDKKQEDTAPPRRP